jgi:hypothetical protein
VDLAKEQHGLANAGVIPQLEDALRGLRRSGSCRPPAPWLEEESPATSRDLTAYLWSLRQQTVFGVNAPLLPLFGAAFPVALLTTL